MKTLLITGLLIFAANSQAAPSKAKTDAEAKEKIVQIFNKFVGDYSSAKAEAGIKINEAEKELDGEVRFLYGNAKNRLRNIDASASHQKPFPFLVNSCHLSDELPVCELGVKDRYKFSAKSLTKDGLVNTFVLADTEEETEKVFYRNESVVQSYNKEYFDHGNGERYMNPGDTANSYVNRWATEVCLGLNTPSMTCEVNWQCRSQAWGNRVTLMDCDYTVTRSALFKYHGTDSPIIVEIKD